MSDPHNADVNTDAPQAADDDVDTPDTEHPHKRQSELVDESLEETFPASDPPTAKHIT
jgi:hypothetical protein